MDDAIDSRSRASVDPYRRGRGGYDPEAAALAAQARYTFRQRMVLVLALFAVISAVLAATLASIDTWYLHGAVDVCLIGYLAYLRRQVRIEQAIRARRAARGAGSRQNPTTAEGERIEQPGRARTTRPTTVAEAVAARQAEQSTPATDNVDAAPEPDPSAEPGVEDDDDTVEPQQPALPRLRPTTLPLPPPGATRLELDDEDPDLHDLQSPQPRGYRRAAGQ